MTKYQTNPTETENDSECSKCKKGLNAKMKWTILLAMYMLFSSVYGTIEIIKYLINFL